MWLGLGLVTGLDRRALDATIAHALSLLRHRASWSRRSLAIIERVHSWPWMRGLWPVQLGPAWLGRALDRDAEHDAERIATALAGSDDDPRRRRIVALAHHLAQAHRYAIHEASRGRPVADLFAVQARFAARWPTIAGATDDTRGEPPWELFTDAAALRAQVTAHDLPRPGGDAAAVALDDTLARLDASLARPHLAPRYRGLYAEPGVTRLPMSAAPPPLDDPMATIEGLYPPELVDELADPAMLAAQRVAAREGRARMAHQQLAATLSPAWVDAVRSRGRLWHWAEHAAADLDDLAATARSVGAGLPLATMFATTDELTRRLARFQVSLDSVGLPPDLEARLDGWPWSFADTTPFGGAVRVVDVGWRATRALAALDDLRAAALDSLLSVEDRVAALAAAGDTAAPAPEPVRTPAGYPQHVRAVVSPPRRTWREPARAAGFAVITATAAALTVVAAGQLRYVTVVAYNGTGAPIAVTIDGQRRTIDVGGHVTFDVDPGRIAVSARTSDDAAIETFHERVDERHRYLYVPATALPVRQDTVAYAERHPLLGADLPSKTLPLRRWQAVTADWFFITPPSTIEAKRGDSKRFQLLSALERDDPYTALSAVDTEDLEGRDAMIEAQLLWRPTTVAHSAAWWQVAAEFGIATQVLPRRLARTPDDAVLRMIEQDLAGDRHAEVCADHQRRAAARPDDLAWQSLAMRCLPPDERSAAFRDAYDRDHTASPWVQLGFGHAAAAEANYSVADRVLSAACTQLPYHCETLVLDIARVRRARGSNAPFSGLPILGGRWDYVANTPPGAWWPELAAGRLAAAISLAEDSDEAAQIRRASWLAAASDGATAELRAEFEANDGLEEPEYDPAIALVIYALRARAGRAAPTDLDEAVHAATSDRGVDAAHHADALRGFLTLIATDGGPSVDAAEAALTPVAPVVRGRAYVAAVLLLGPRCPPKWRELAQQLLFDHERPWFTPT